MDGRKIGIGRLDEWAGEGVGLTTAGYHRISHAIPGTPGYLYRYYV